MHAASPRPAATRGAATGAPPALVIFDCDGVLVDSETIYLDAELTFLARSGVVFERATYLRTYMGLAPDEWRERLRAEAVQRTGRPLPPTFFDELDAFLDERFAAELRPLPDVRATVAALDAACCVASSTPLPRLTWKLEHTGLLDLFAPHVFSSQMVARGKPAPDLFLHAARTMDADPARCVVVEDSANGVRAGRAAGMAVIGFTGGGHCLPDHAAQLAASGAHTVVDDFAGLTAAVAAVAR